MLSMLLCVHAVVVAFAVALPFGAHAPPLGLRPAGVSAPSALAQPHLWLCLLAHIYMCERDTNTRLIFKCFFIGVLRGELCVCPTMRRAIVHKVRRSERFVRTTGRTYAHRDRECCRWVMAGPFVRLLLLPICKANECFVVAGFVELLTSTSRWCLDSQQHIVVSEHEIELFLGITVLCFDSVACVYAVRCCFRGRCRHRRSSFAAVNV